MKQIIYNLMDTPIDGSADGVVLTEPFLRLKNHKYLTGRSDVEIMEDAYADQQALLKSYQFAISKMEELVKVIQQWSNRKYGINLSFDQYRMIYYEFFLNSVFTVYTAYNKLSRYDDLADCFFYGHEHKILGKVRFRFVEEYYAFLYEFLLEKSGAQNRGKKITVGYAEWAEVLPKYRVMMGYIRHPLRTVKFYGNLIRNVNANSLLVRTFLPEESAKRIRGLSGGNVQIMDMRLFEWLEGKYDNDITVRFDKTLRQDMLSEFECQNEFEYLLKDIMIEIMPPLLCEKFLPSYQRAEKVANKYRVNKLYSAAGLWVPYGYMFASVLKGNGTKVYDIQHSAAYDYVKPTSWPEIAVYDDFITWGWAEPNPYKEMRPLVCTRFIDHKKSETRVNGTRILLVTNDFSTRETIAGDYPIDFIQRHFSFVSTLSDEMRKVLVIRLRADVLGLAEIYKREYPEVTIEYSGDIPATESIDKSTIVVTDHNSSMFMETLMMGKPIFFYDGLKPLSVNECMLRWLKKLEMGGLYYADGEQLAKAISDGMDNLIAKYYGKDNRILIKRFVQEFLGNWENAEDIWLREFME